MTYWKKWAHAACIRAMRTVAQGALGAIGGATMFGEVNVAVVVSTALLAGVCSLLNSLAGLPEVEAER